MKLEGPGKTQFLPYIAFSEPSAPSHHGTFEGPCFLWLPENCRKNALPAVRQSIHPSIPVQSAPANLGVH